MQGEGRGAGGAGEVLFVGAGENGNCFMGKLAGKQIALDGRICLPAFDDREGLFDLFLK